MGNKMLKNSPSPFRDFFRAGLFSKISAILLAIFLAASPAFSETGDDYDGDAPDEEDGKIALSENMNEPGDQFIKIGLMVTKPLNFDGHLLLGGAGELGYHRFLTSNFAWGIDVSFGYNPTIGENTFTYVPLVLDFTYQLSVKKFEIPLTVGVGAAMENYLSNTYFPGLVVKGEAGVFYRVTPAWSFGVDAQFMWMPEWYSNSKYNDFGNFGSIEVAARYHF